MHAGGLRYDYLIEVLPTGSEGGEIVWEWSTWDYLVQDFDSSKENYGDPSEHPELIDINFRRPQSWSSKSWLHTNGIDYNPELDQIALSTRENSELWIIDHSASTEEAATQARVARCCTDGAIRAPTDTERLPIDGCSYSTILSG